jgi:ADP-ribosylglycohydrolase
MEQSSLKAVLNSASWAAYGDALGFITELVDINGVKRRISTTRVTKTVSWRRFVGGRFGAQATLPAGCYSDDTQLRLATSRAIRGDGLFDVEIFAKVELPVWISYALGAGKGTKTAASFLARNDVNWFSNFFNKKNSNYLHAGGNGAAMRIQPHIWAAANRSKPETFMADVIRNAICTHGHPRGVLGAVFHALCLASAFSRGTVPSPDLWKEFVNFFSQVINLIREDNELSTFWLPVWEERSKNSIDKEFGQVKDECLKDIEIVRMYIDDKSEEAYHKLVEDIGGLRENQRGSGTKTAIIAVALSYIYRNDETSKALEIAANLLSSDTDTIATMVGAILGALEEKPPNGDVIDRTYIDGEATRLYRISRGHPTESFTYPDLLAWQPPKTQLDAFGVVNNGLYLAGLAKAKQKGEKFTGRGKGDPFWQWLELDFGQTIIGKLRADPKPLPTGNLPSKPQAPRVIKPSYQSELKKSESTEQTDLFSARVVVENSEEKEVKYKPTIDDLTSEAIKSGFDSSLIGSHLLDFAGQPDGIEQAIAYASIIVKAKRARSHIQLKGENSKKGNPVGNQKGDRGKYG